MKDIISILISILTGIMTSLFVSLLFYKIQEKKDDYKNLYRCLHCYWIFEQYINKNRGNCDTIVSAIKNLLKEQDELGKLLTLTVDKDIEKIGQKHWNLFQKYSNIFISDKSVEIVEKFCEECVPIINEYIEYRKNIFKRSIKEILKGKFGIFIIGMITGLVMALIIIA